MAYRDSVSVSAPGLALEGVWVMDPLRGGQESARQYRYGSAQRQESLDAMGEATYYAGRTDPVADFGEHEAYALAVTLDISHGPSWREDVEDLKTLAAMKRVLHVRDNRGRAVYGTLEGFRVQDQAWGTQVSFTVERRDRVVEEVSA